MRSISKYKYLVWSILLLIALAVFLCWKHYSSNSNVLSHTVRLPVQHTSLSTVQSGVSKQSKNFALLSGGIADASEEHAYAWVLPVHRFSGHHDAEQLLEKMQESGFDSYIETKRSVNGSLSFRVLIGPKLNRSEFVTTRQELLRQLHLNAGALEPYTDHA